MALKVFVYDPDGISWMTEKINEKFAENRAIKGKCK